MFPLLKRGGGARKVLPCLEGGGGAKVSDTRSSHFVAPPPLPVINDQSLRLDHVQIRSTFIHNIDSIDV